MEKNYTKQIVDVGLKVKKLRESKNLTQLELADKCEIDIRSIQRIERGEFGFGLHILFALATALDISPSDLLKNIK